MALTKSYLDELTYKINGAIIEVHRHLGPGLLESIYHKCLKHELTLRNIKFQSELLVPINYKGLVTDADIRCDLLIENTIVVELKSVKAFEPIFTAQLLSYMNLLKKPKGILVNFNVLNIMNSGHKTIVNDYFWELDE